MDSPQARNNYRGEGEGLKFLIQVFSHLSDPELKLTIQELRAWNPFVGAVKGFLNNNTDTNYELLLIEL